MRPDLGMGDPVEPDMLPSAVGLVWRALVLWLLVILLVTLANWRHDGAASARLLRGFLAPLPELREALGPVLRTPVEALLQLGEHAVPRGERLGVAASRRAEIGEPPPAAISDARIRA